MSLRGEFVGSIGTPEASELSLGVDPRLVCETYIFEPATAEVALGHLYAVGETEDRNGIGKELLDMTIQALQREYYREPGRGLPTSFESALHQANIVLHDAAEQGVRDWMGYWHVTIGVIADSTLHISTAGNGVMFLVRKARATLLTEDLSYSPITDPLRTFSQVASGTLAARDVLFLGTSAFQSAFRREDLVRFSVEHSAQTISTRLSQLYADQETTVPLATMVVSILPRHIATARPTLVLDTTTPTRRQRHQGVSLTPRPPLVIHRTALRAAAALVAQVVVATWRWSTQRGWPLLMRGSRRGTQVVASASVMASRNVQAATRHGLQRWPSWQVGWRAAVQAPRRLVARTWQWLAALPRTSKIFAAIALLLAGILLISIWLLQSKRADDATIQQASETLHTAQTKVAAAETALIYDNRDQARTLLNEASADVQKLQNQNVFVDEAQQVAAAIGAMQDRLQKVLRASTVQTRVVGDFASLVGQQQPGGLAFVDGRLYSFNPQTNEIFALSDTGQTQTVSATSQGIGALRLAIPHPADKNIVFVTDAPGIAIFDTKTATLQQQDISWPTDHADITSAAVYGSHLYVVEKGADTIYSYNKILRGYNGRRPWLLATDFPTQSIVSLAVEGSVYTLHTDGSVRELFKGKPVEFAVEAIDPPLMGARKLVTFEGFANIYVFDPDHQRVVIFNKKGGLVRQVIVDVAQKLTDIAVATDESTLYILDGTRVLALPLGG